MTDREWHEMTNHEKDEAIEEACLWAAKKAGCPYRDAADVHEWLVDHDFIEYTSCGYIPTEKLRHMFERRVFESRTRTLQ